MPNATNVLSPLSPAATSARRLSLRSTEEMLRGVLRRVAATPDALARILGEHDERLLAFTASRTIVAANEAAERLFGYDRNAITGLSSDALVPVRLRQPDAPPMQSSDTLTTVELPGLRRDGTEPELSWTFGAVDTPGGPLFVMVVRDRAEIDDALEALYASEQRFRLLVEGVRDHAFIMLDADGRVATWNAGAERIKGWSADNVIGQSFEIFYSAEERAAGEPKKLLQAAIDSGHFRLQGWLVRKDGTRFYAETSFWPLFTHGGTLQGFANITHDMTAKRSAEDAERRLVAERAARESAEARRDQLVRLHRLAHALSSATTPEEVGAVVLDECLTEVDAAGGAVYALSRDAGELRLLGEHGHPAGLFSAFTTFPTAARTAAGDAIRAHSPLFFESADAFATAYPEFEHEIRVGGFEASVTIPLIAQEPIGVFVVRYRQRQTFSEAERSLLLTMAELCAQALERARLFEAQLQARAQAEAASRAKDEFLAMLGHELRNPLAPIATAVELMKLRGETHSLREREVIERQVGHITRLVDDLLDISRITRGKLELSLRPVHLADVVARAVEMASPLLEQRHHKLSLEVSRHLMTNGDPGRLAQVIANLLSNAAKYTPPNGQIAVRASATATDVTLAVVDNGVGVAPDLLPRVFDLFVQGKRTFDRSEGGLGIGLALVKNLVSLHGGTVAAASTGPGKGSEFTIVLPRYIAPTERDAAAAPADVREVRKGKRVLVVDDNTDFADMLASTLTALGYEVTKASDAVSALERLRDFPAEAAVLDLGLPVLDGFELARKIQEEFPARIPRLIAVTGYGQHHDRVRSAEVGFAEHLVKPIEMDIMIDALER